MLRPPAEMSADAMANQLRYNDCVSMVVRRENNIKNRMGEYYASSQQTNLTQFFTLSEMINSLYVVIKDLPNIKFLMACSF